MIVLYYQNPCFREYRFDDFPFCNAKIFALVSGHFRCSRLMISKRSSNDGISYVEGRILFNVILGSGWFGEIST